MNFGLEAASEYTPIFGRIAADSKINARRGRIARELNVCLAALQGAAAPNLHVQTVIPTSLLIWTLAVPKLSGLWETHHSSFNPNCTCRELVEVEVMTPAVAEGSTVVAEVKTTGFGLLKLV